MTDLRALTDFERDILQARETRERERCDGDRRQRERLERMASGGQRLSLVDLLNEDARRQAAGALPGIDAIQKVRDRQRLNAVTAEQHNRSYERLAKQGVFESFDRVVRQGTVNATHATAPVYDGSNWRPGRASRYPADTPLPEKGPGPYGPVSDTHFNFASDDPGSQEGRFGGWPEGDPALRAGRVGDVETRVRGEESRYQPSGRIKAADADWLLDTALKLIQEARSRRHAESKV